MRTIDPKAKDHGLIGGLTDENDWLRAELNQMSNDFADCNEVRENWRLEAERLRALNAELVAALEGVLPYAQAAIGLPEQSWPRDSVILKARAAIAKAKGL